MQSVVQRAREIAASLDNNRSQRNEQLLARLMAQMNIMPGNDHENPQTDNLDRQVDVIEQVIPDQVAVIKVRVGRLPINACIDTGESVCLIRPEAVPLEAPRGFCCVYLNIAKGDTHSLNQTCVLDVDFGGKIERIRFFIYPQSFTMMTLGIDWMIKSKVNLDLGANSLSLDGLTLSMKMRNTTELEMTYYGQTDRHAWHPLPKTIPRNFVDWIQKETAAEGTDVEDLLQYVTMFQQVFIRHGVIRIQQEKHWPRYYVPARLRNIAINAFHHTPGFGHLGPKAIFEAMKIHYYWPGMRQDIASAVGGHPTRNHNRYPGRFLHAAQNRHGNVRHQRQDPYRPSVNECPRVRAYARQGLAEQVKRARRIMELMYNNQLQMPL